MARQIRAGEVARRGLDVIANLRYAGSRGLPRTEIFFFRDHDGRAPVRDWLQGLRFANPRAWFNCHARLRLLADLGFEIRRPYADYLRDGLYELRIRAGREQIRILYFFQGQNVVVLAHALRKERFLPESDLRRALDRKRANEADPETHTSSEGWTDA
jgi:phage-related protein